MESHPGHGKATAYLLLITLQLLLASCHQSPPEAAIRSALDNIETAIEKGNAGDVMDSLSDDFQLQRHGQTLSRKDTARLLVGTLLRYPQRHLTVTNIRIKVDPVTGKQARVRFTVLAWGGSQPMPDSARSYQVDSQWQQEGDWQIRQLSAK
ncbi:MAG: nuclear transport factor 2 family protein [Alcanivorax sp.]|nr:nuclear transport factor 2 family protein [Alcanivorax sp.]